MQQVVDSSLLSAADVRALIDSLPAEERPHGADQLAQELVRRKLLTAYQLEQIQAGQGRSLVLGNYAILDKLGQGGMGLVLKAEHRRMKRLVALKVLSPQVVRTPELLRRFQREVEAAAKLSHPNIVIAHDADEAGDTHFLVMEYVEGTDLSTLVKRDGPLPVGTALDYILQAAHGLEYAHQHGVIHRDIKPANLLVSVVSCQLSVAPDDRTITADHGRLTTDHGQRTTLKILDMGLARVESAGGTQDELTGSGQIMGTVDYMAPEQAANTKRADQRADIYSLGLTLWYLLTGRPAYPGDSAVEKLMAHQTQPIPSLRTQRPAVSSALDAVFVKMVAKTPEVRYQTMTEVIAALESCRGTASSAATDLEATLDMSSPHVATDPHTQATLATPRPAWWRDRRVAAIAAGVLVMLLGVWIVKAAWPRGSSRESLSSNDAAASNNAPAKTTRGPNAADLKSEISDLKFEEPPPLDEWLKGRTILTVAQDGSGIFTSIQSALNALKRGQVVNVLDNGPYRENLSVLAVPDECGLVSKVGTLIAPDGYKYYAEEPSGRNWQAHHVKSQGSFRLSGFVFLTNDDGKKSRCLDAHAGLVLEHCVFAGHGTNALSRDLGTFQTSPGHQRTVIRDNIFCRICYVLQNGGDVLITRNLYAVPAATAFQLDISSHEGRRRWSVVAQNVVQGIQECLQVSGVDSRAGVPDEIRIEGNTLDCLDAGLRFLRRLPPSRVTIRNNVFSASPALSFSQGAENDVAGAAEWQVDHNGYKGDFAIVSFPSSFRNVKWSAPFFEKEMDRRNCFRVTADGPLATGGAGGDLPTYIGALPPGPAPPEGDWFTRLLERWEEVQQRIEKRQAEDAAVGREVAPGTAKDAPSEKPRTLEKVQ